MSLECSQRRENSMLPRSLMLGVLACTAACGSSPASFANPNAACSCATQIVPVKLTPVPVQAGVEAILEGTSATATASCQTSSDCQKLGLSGLSPGTYNITVTAKGYNNATASVAFSPARATAWDCQCGFVLDGPINISLTPNLVTRWH